MLIRLKNIALYAHHGVHDFEREHGTRFELDVQVTVPDTSGAQDKLGDTLDYTAVYKTIIQLSTNQKFNLLEAWAHYLTNAIFEKYAAVEEITISIRKPGAAIGGPIGTVEVELTKKR